MGDGYRIDDMAELKQFHGWLNTVPDAYREVNTYVRTEVCNKSGFTGVLSRLGDALDHVSDGFWDLTYYGVQKFEDTEEAFFLTARTYSKAEGEAVGYFRKSDREVEAAANRQMNERRAEHMEKRLAEQGLY